MMKMLFGSLVLLVGQMDAAYQGTLSTGLAGTSQVDGNIFEIRTKDYPVTIERMDIHMKETATVLPIAVWYRPGEANPLYDESYVNAIDANMIGNGMNVLTSLPAFPTPIVLPARTTYTFYVSTSKNGEEALYYGMGSELGKAYVSDDFLEIGEGYAMRYSFSSPAFPRQWNGVIHYTTTGPPPTTGSPTQKPTALSTSPPSSVTQTAAPTSQTPPPSSKPTLAPSSNPTRAPTASPTKTPSPTAAGTNAPTTPPAPSLSPTTRMPLDLRSMTVSPTISPTDKPTDVPTSAPPTTSSSTSPSISPTASALPTVMPTKDSSGRKWAIDCLIYLLAVVAPFLV
ncbi:hypothetical protein ACHAWO_002814 [Cyclotella atomus]|uniref:Uncharacterized protein n=1 Tax=Cyclotella atomus TaxID=382360 RepID=A0ABD3PND0_9STRA